MKKAFIILFFTSVLASCSKKSDVYQQDIQGTWGLYKYVLRNADETSAFKALHPSYSISFTSSAFIETDSAGYYNPGTFSFANNDQSLVLKETILSADSIPVSIERQYTIYNLTSVSVQLRNDSSELYLHKQL